MKKRNLQKHTYLKFALAGLISISTIIGHTQTCENINGDFETYTGTLGASSTTNGWINTNLSNWYAAHGHIHAVNSGSDVDLELSAGLVPSALGLESISGGAYTDFNFVNGVTYTITYDIDRAYLGDPLTDFNMRLTNGMTPKGDPTFPVHWHVPTIAGTQLVSNHNLASPGWTTISETFTADSTYSQLWLYPELIDEPGATMGIDEVYIDNVCIEQVTADPCEIELNFTHSFSGDWCKTTFENTSIYPIGGGFQVLKTMWDFGDGNIGTGNIVDHSYTAAGIYIITLEIWTTNGLECCKTRYTQEIEITEFCPPCEVLYGAEITASGTNPFTFDATIAPAVHTNLYGYYWDFGDGTTGSGKSVDHSYALTGSYIVSLTVFYFDDRTGECCSYTVYQEVYASEIPGGGGGDDPGHWSPIKDEDGRVIEKHTEALSFLNVYPNPSDGVFTLLPSDGISIATVSVYDNSGKRVYASQNNSDNSELNLDLSHLEKGMYTLIVNEANPNNKVHKKIMIK